MTGNNPVSKDNDAGADPVQEVTALPPGDRSWNRRRTAVRWGSVAAVAVAIAAAVTVTVVRAQNSEPDLSAVSSFTVKQGHVKTPVTYAQSPPVGGVHSPVLLNCGAYAAPVHSENAVHSMEHGAVWVTYRPDLPAAQVTMLREQLPSTYVLLSPFPGLQAPVVVSAWGKQLVLTGADDARLDAFVKVFRRGPQTPEPRRPCTGGTGKPALTGG